ncbi:uncharacterized protein F4822DRAFT_395663 [Hypoxylon trugodes]|uniref:uncharacterized protein n=1 Tax=Hypoxylon trugodes TaxID=326681 RepID=UPI00219E3FE7|nr:uncharacterized protein F4822DRAFT_395663 [Hypoxylon trugodes]KAI1391130.1 hypothetical protein F4822DRAFT_395663 [Hypoxylon trugodes]
MDEGETISDERVAPLIQILAWLFLSFCIISVAAQFITKHAMSKPFEVTDILLFVALVHSY